MKFRPWVVLVSRGMPEEGWLRLVDNRVRIGIWSKTGYVSQVQVEEVR